MPTQEIIFTMPDRPGQLSVVSDLLGENGLNIKAVIISIENDKAILSMVLDDHERGKLVLQGNGYDVTEKDVIAAYTPDHPGGLGAVMKPLKRRGINVDKLYMSVARKGEKAVVILEVDDYERAVEALKANYVEIAESQIF